LPSKRTPDSVVSFKGFSEGILMSLMLKDYEFDRVIRKAASIYKKKQDFFGSSVDLYATGFERELTDDEGGMVRTMFHYLMKKQVFTYRENPSESQNPASVSPTTPSSNQYDIPTTVPASSEESVDLNEFLVIGKAVRAGVVVQSPGNIVIFGDVHSGAKVFAGKSLYVFGSIKGEVGFGNKPGCKQALLACQGMKAMRVYAADKTLDGSISSLNEVSIPVYIYFNEGEVSIVKMTQN